MHTGALAVLMADIIRPFYFPEPSATRTYLDGAAPTMTWPPLIFSPVRYRSAGRQLLGGSGKGAECKGPRLCCSTTEPVLRLRPPEITVSLVVTNSHAAWWRKLTRERGIWGWRDDAALKCEALILVHVLFECKSS